MVFDNLIAKHEMPITIGVFITPGILKADVTNALDRFNRSYEYDGLGSDLMITARTGSNLTFGGENFDILYASCGDKIFRRKVKVKGALLFPAPMKPGAPRL